MLSACMACLSACVAWLSACMAWLSVAWNGLAHGMAWLSAWHGVSRHVSALLGMARHGSAWLFPADEGRESRCAAAPSSEHADVVTREVSQIRARHLRKERFSILGRGQQVARQGIDRGLASPMAFDAEQDLAVHLQPDQPLRMSSSTRA